MKEKLRKRFSTSYIGGLFLSDMIAPGGRYLSFEGFIIVGVIVFLASVLVGCLGNFDERAIGGVPIFMAIFLVVLSLLANIFKKHVAHHPAPVHEHEGNGSGFSDRQSIIGGRQLLPGGHRVTGS